MVCFLADVREIGALGELSGGWGRGRIVSLKLSSRFFHDKIKHTCKVKTSKMPDDESWVETCIPLLPSCQAAVMYQLPIKAQLCPCWQCIVNNQSAEPIAMIQIDKPTQVRSDKCIDLDDLDKSHSMIDITEERVKSMFDTLKKRQ